MQEKRLTRKHQDLLAFHSIESRALGPMQFDNNSILSK
jgi:hypothetical protein